jgi:hypothetical protein
MLLLIINIYKYTLNKKKKKKKKNERKKLNTLTIHAAIPKYPQNGHVTQWAHPTGQQSIQPLPGDGLEGVGAPGPHTGLRVHHSNDPVAGGIHPAGPPIPV